MAFHSMHHGDVCMHCKVVQRPTSHRTCKQLMRDSRNSSSSTIIIVPGLTFHVRFCRAVYVSARFYQHLSIYVLTQEPDPEPELSAYEEIESGLLNIGVAPGKLEA